eukprot:CAMPEP_0119541802 /NCGR_PEP_ID=MMETSP1344-20130328/53187_1 /TAXON_ID=236787 /ORGANISM="Florenciella parvula, Strain CCMP2471" /LENGTH=531 /DNA_ID=CAMNT_0007585875 /DNA_START=257 /DNA_END=1852 /DNA_ORIENTATION=+
MATLLRGALAITAALTSASAFAPSWNNARGPSAIALAPVTSAHRSASSARMAMSTSELPKVDVKKLPTSVQRAIKTNKYDPNKDRFVKVVGDELQWGEDRWDRAAITKYWQEQTGMGSTEPRWDSLLSSKANRKDRVLMAPGAMESAVIEPEGWCKARHQFKINNTFDEKKGRYYNEVSKERSQAAQRINSLFKTKKTSTETDAPTEEAPKKKKKKKNSWTKFNEKRMAKVKAQKASLANGTTTSSPKPKAKASKESKAKSNVKKTSAPKTVSKPKRASSTVLESLKDEDICAISGDYENCMMAGDGERKLQQLAKSGLKKGTIKFWNKKSQYGFITPSDKRNGGTGDVFVHLSALLKQSVDLGEGAPVEYDLQKGPSDRMGGQPRASLVIVSDPCWIEPKKDYRNGRDPLKEPKGDYRKGRDPSKAGKQPKGDFRKKPTGGKKKGDAKKGGEAKKVSAKGGKSPKAASTGGAKKQGEKQGVKKQDEKKAVVGAAGGAVSSAAAKPQPTGEQKTNLLQVLMNIPTRTGLAP